MDFIIDATLKAVKHLYQADLSPADVSLQQTRKEFEGQVTVVTFTFTKIYRKAPEQTGQAVPTAPESANKQQTTEKAAPAGDAAKVSSDADRDVKSKRTERHVGGRYAGYRHGPLYNSYRGDGWYHGCHRHRLMPWLWC